MEEHFAQTLNETEHLEYMESRGGNTYWVDRFLPDTSFLSIIGLCGLLWVTPRSAYHFLRGRIHASETYGILNKI